MPDVPSGKQERTYRFRALKSALIKGGYLKLSAYKYKTNATHYITKGGI